MIFLTGGTGFVGSYLLFHLLKKGVKVRALKRPEAHFRQTEQIFRYLAGKYPQGRAVSLSQIEWITGSLEAPESFQDQLSGVDTIYHAAALVSFDPRDKNKLFQTNYAGTRDMVDIALEYNIPRLAYLSSVATLPRRDGKITDESDIGELPDFGSAYAESKYRAEMEVHRGFAEGLQGVIVNPSIILGIGDFTRGSLKIFDTVRKGLKFYPTGSCGMVDADDVARAMIELMNHEALFGGRFVLNSECISWENLFNMMASEMHIAAPKIATKPWQASIYWRIEALKSLLTGDSPIVTKETARASYQDFCYSSGKLIRLLPDFHFTPISSTIRDAAQEILSASSNSTIK